MQDTHQLKNCLFGFLSNMSFTSYEFKDLRLSFIHCYPEFSSKKYYSKIYLIIRELTNFGMILVDRKGCTYKYTSNYSKAEILSFISFDTSASIRQILLLEHNNVLDNIELLDNEINAYYSYSEKFPIILDAINILINKKKKELIILRAELNALKNILEIKC